MAKITLGEQREQESSYQFYKQPSERGEIIVVRRKVAMPSDVEHKSSRATKRQRETFSRASKRWASLPGPVKADFRKKYGIVDAQTPHGLSDIKVLQGAQLFTSQEIHLQKYHDEHQEVPFYLCFVLTDERGSPLDLEARLQPYYYPYWHPCPGYYLCTENTLFYPVPEDADLYKLGYATMGTFGYQIFTYRLPELKKVQYRSVAPYISAHYGGWFIVPTHPPAFDWKAFSSPGPPYLWAYHVHQPTGEAWGECFPWTAFTLTWQKITPGIFTLTISLGYLVRDDVLYLTTFGLPPIIWRITKEGFTNPPQHTCRYRIAPWEILGYEN